MRGRKNPETVSKEVETLAEVYAKLNAQKEPAVVVDEPVYWQPTFGPSQQRIFDSNSKFILAHGERYSGKTHVCLHKVVRHAWTYHNAKVLMVVGLKRQGTLGGAWEALTTEILPEWEANLEGFSFSPPRQTQEKDLICEIVNQYGTRSIFQLISIPYGTKLAARARGIQVTAVFVDELVGIGGPEYLTALGQQLGRAKHVPADKQFYIAATNPDGPSHWVHQKWWGFTKDDGVFVPPVKGGEVFHVPIQENPLPQAIEYYETNVKPMVADDPTEFARLVEGKWVDRPSGEALFAKQFVEEVHVRGDLAEGTILRPKPGIVVDDGYDLGDVNSCIVLMQMRHTAEKTIWVVFDEIIYTDKEVPYEELVPEIMDRREYWAEMEQHSFVWESISDKSAFDRFRASSGSYDHRQVAQLSKKWVEDRPKDKEGKTVGWTKRPIHLLECPKPSGSVAGRIKLLRGLLVREEIYISVRCKRVIAMLKSLESEKDEPFKPKRCEHLHVFDALTYPIFYHSLGGPSVGAGEQNSIKPEIRQLS